MNRASRYTLRLGQRARFRRRLTTGLLAAVAACALAAVRLPAPEQTGVASAHEAVRAPAAPAAAEPGKPRPARLARFPVEAQEPSLALPEAWFEEGVEEEAGALVSVAGPDLAGGDTHAANAPASSPSVSTAGPSQAAPGRAPVGAGGLVLPSGIGDLRKLGLVSTSWADQHGTTVRGGIAIDPARGSAPPMLVALDTSAQPDEAPASDPDPFVPRPDPSRPPRPDSTLADASKPADVPEPATCWLLAVALSALLALRHKGWSAF